MTYCKQRSNVDIEADVSKRGRNDLAPSVVTVLTDLGDKNTRSSPLALLEVLFKIEETSSHSASTVNSALRANQTSILLEMRSNSALSPYSVLYAPLTILSLAT